MQQFENQQQKLPQLNLDKLAASKTCIIASGTHSNLSKHKQDFDYLKYTQEKLLNAFYLLNWASKQATITTINVTDNNYYHDDIFKHQSYDISLEYNRVLDIKRFLESQKWDYVLYLGACLEDNALDSELAYHKLQTPNKYIVDSCYITTPYATVQTRTKDIKFIHIHFTPNIINNTNYPNNNNNTNSSTNSTYNSNTNNNGTYNSNTNSNRPPFTCIIIQDHINSNKLTSNVSGGIPPVSYRWSGPGPLSHEDQKEITAKKEGIYLLECIDRKGNITADILYKRCKSSLPLTSNRLSTSKTCIIVYGNNKSISKAKASDLDYVQDIQPKLDNIFYLLDWHCNELSRKPKTNITVINITDNTNTSENIFYHHAYDFISEYNKVNHIKNFIETQKWDYILYLGMCRDNLALDSELGYNKFTNPHKYVVENSYISTEQQQSNQTKLHTQIPIDNIQFINIDFNTFKNNYHNTQKEPKSTEIYKANAIPINAGSSHIPNTYGSRPELDLQVNIQSKRYGSKVQLTADVSGGLPPYTIHWKGPNYFFSSNATIAINEDGIYEVKITDLNNNKISDFEFIQINPTNQSRPSQSINKIIENPNNNNQTYPCSQNKTCHKELPYLHLQKSTKSISLSDNIKTPRVSPTETVATPQYLSQYLALFNLNDQMGALSKKISKLQKHFINIYAKIETLKKQAYLFNESLTKFDTSPWTNADFEPFIDIFSLGQDLSNLLIELKTIIAITDSILITPQPDRAKTLLEQLFIVMVGSPYIALLDEKFITINNFTEIHRTVKYGINKTPSSSANLYSNLIAC